MFQLLTVQSSDSATREVLPMPPDIQQILDDFPTVCAPPTELPPIRPNDHSIPLIQGARLSTFNHTGTLLH